jgi:hypothetical protein
MNLHPAYPTSRRLAAEACIAAAAARPLFRCEADDIAALRGLVASIRALSAVAERTRLRSGSVQGWTPADAVLELTALATQIEDTAREIEARPETEAREIAEAVL